jgi:epoxyqueuosine reductase
VDAPPLEHLAEITEEEFRAMFRDSPVTRSRYAGFLRNVAIAMGNSGQERFRAPLERLARHSEAMVREPAMWALEQEPFGPPATMRE